MKKSGVGLLFLGVLFMGCFLPEADAGQYSGRVSVTGELRKNRDSSKTEAEKTSSKSKTEVQQYELTVTVANTGKLEGSFDVEWYFFKRSLDDKGDKGDLVLAEQGKKTLALMGMKRETFPVKSKELKWSETKSSTSSSNKNSSSKSKTTIKGDVYGGYVVLLKADGEVIARYSPDRKCTTDDWLKEMSIPFE